MYFVLCTWTGSVPPRGMYVHGSGWVRSAENVENCVPTRYREVVLT